MDGLTEQHVESRVYNEKCINDLGTIKPIKEESRMNLSVLLITETPFYSNFLLSVSKNGPSEDLRIQFLLPGRKS